jgi:hypothetical protein
MDVPLHDSHSFVIRIWLEESADEAGRTIWRGHITHVFTKKRRYFQRLDEISPFIQPFLEQLGIPPEQP